MHQRALSFSSRQGFVNNFIFSNSWFIKFEQPHESRAHSLDEYGALSSAAARYFVVLRILRALAELSYTICGDRFYSSHYRS